MERDLFRPIKEYFEAQGFEGDGEVGDIDLYMEKDGSSLAVELKVTLDFRSVQQAALRQKIVDTVFIGIFRPRDLFSRAFKDKLYLLKRLGIGLIVVSPKTRTVEIVSEPVVSELSNFQKKNKGKKIRVSGEFQKRKTRSNTGGVHATKLITGYREDALRVLDTLAELGGEASSREIKKLSGVENSTRIMYDNFYGWFENVSKGTYRLLDSGYAALEEFETEIKKLCH